MAIITPPNDMPQDVIDFRTRTAMPESYVDELWSRRPGFLVATIAGAYADINNRLRKRYRVPFAIKPEIVVRWMTRLVTPEVYRARGVDSSDEQIALLDQDRVTAYAEIKEAADSKDGLFDLPTDDALDTSAVTKGGPLGYSEASPYSWSDVQADAVGTGPEPFGWRR